MEQNHEARTALPTAIGLETSLRGLCRRWCTQNSKPWSEWLVPHGNGQFWPPMFTDRGRPAQMKAGKGRRLLVTDWFGLLPTTAALALPCHPRTHSGM